MFSDNHRHGDLAGYFRVERKILLIETSEDKAKPDYILYYLRNLGAQGILQEINGIIVGKPQDEVYYEEYKKVYKR